MPGSRRPVPWHLVVVRTSADDPDATRHVLGMFLEPGRAEALARWLAAEIGLDAADHASLEPARDQAARGRRRVT